jgi:outer membrane protein assembly factor BamB
MTIVRPLTAIAAAMALTGCATAANVGDAVWPFGDSEPKTEAPKDGRISILNFEQRLEADQALAGRTPTLGQLTDVADWSQPGGPADNHPYHMNAGSDLSVAWRRDIGAGSDRTGRMSSPPVIANGKLFVLDAENRLHAFSADRGQKLWTKKLSPNKGRDRHALGGGVAAAGDKVFVTSGFAFAAAYDAATGAEAWRTSSNAPFHAAPTVSGGRLFAVTNDSELLAMDAASGAVQWTHQAIAEPARILAASSPAVEDDLVIAPFASGEIVALLAANGRRLWVDALTRAGRLTSLSAINDVAGRPVAVDGVIYAASHSGILAAIDQRTGQRLWSFGLASTQTPLVSGDTVFVATVDGELAAIERNEGKMFWVTQLRRFKDEKDKKGRITWTGPLLAGGKLVLASSIGEAVIVDPANGQVGKTVKLGAPVFIPPIAAGGQVYLTTDEGGLVVLR